ncbi:DUF4177 domain-containing protein [Thalassobium sp. R2A62]|jgi:hypothetical protein|uniref:DUF4177 domain-containing protein n=1 Tax=Thalassobium sp. R2A62 TaxID=633131 RepID=UPI0001B1D492|nr:DUF4177 domain-containing protein [Thalassobium sp. R2A62]EET48490.1 hypothetical protein TR2A62_1224 [Thalassobium sp. R2A62]MDG1338969.1 DUF4177 domain-containing protein [Paracoccaceae bacterium]MDG2453586.1 DUF4177 domain-containing protein [Paracoccaceae bacterium]
MRFEYKVIPAPKKGRKARGVRGTEKRFANALELAMNELAAEGWEYQRTDTLPCEERQGLTGRTTSFQNMLVFRRTVDEAVDRSDVLAIAAPVDDLSDDIEDADDENPIDEGQTDEDIADLEALDGVEPETADQDTARQSAAE